MITLSLIALATTQLPASDNTPVTPQAAESAVNGQAQTLALTPTTITPLAISAPTPQEEAQIVPVSDTTKTDESPDNQPTIMMMARSLPNPAQDSAPTTPEKLDMTAQPTSQAPAADQPALETVAIPAPSTPADVTPVNSVPEVTPAPTVVSATLEITPAATPEPMMHTMAVQESTQVPVEAMQTTAISNDEQVKVVKVYPVYEAAQNAVNHVVNAARDMINYVYNFITKPTPVAEKKIVVTDSAVIPAEKKSAEDSIPTIPTEEKTESDAVKTTDNV